MKKKKQIERRQGMFDSQNNFSRMSGGPRTRMQRHSSARGLQSDTSSRYINTDHKRNQIDSRGGQATTLAYSLNKNLKNLKISDHKKKRPKTAGRKPPRSKHNMGQQYHYQGAPSSNDYMQGIYADQHNNPAYNPHNNMMQQ